MFSFLHHRSNYRYYFWGWIFLIILLYLVPGLVLEEVQIRIRQLEFEIRFDYLAHFSIFFIWTFIFVVWKWPEIVGRRHNSLGLFISLGFLFSSSIEILHYYIPTRTFNPMDMISNASGFIIGVIFILLVTYTGFLRRFVDFLKKFD